jgi:hypothetical protein
MTTNIRPKRVTLHTRMRDALEAAGHKLETRRVGGVIDEVNWQVSKRRDSNFGFDHIGPRCVRCGTEWCMWCWDDGAEKIETCRG